MKEYRGKRARQESGGGVGVGVGAGGACLQLPHGVMSLNLCHRVFLQQTLHRGPC